MEQRERERERETTKVYFEYLSPKRKPTHIFVFGINSLMHPTTGSMLVSIASGLPA